MQIEIRNPARPCETCGAGEAIYVPAHNAHLERDVLAALDELAPGRWRPIRRLALRIAKQLIAEAADELRQRTIHVA